MSRTTRWTCCLPIILAGMMAVLAAGPVAGAGTGFPPNLTGGLPSAGALSGWVGPRAAGAGSYTGGLIVTNGPVIGPSGNVAPAPGTIPLPIPNIPAPLPGGIAVAPPLSASNIGVGLYGGIYTFQVLGPAGRPGYNYAYVVPMGPGGPLGPVQPGVVFSLPGQRPIISVLTPNYGPGMPPAGMMNNASYGPGPGYMPWNNQGPYSTGPYNQWSPSYYTGPGQGNGYNGYGQGNGYNGYGQSNGYNGYGQSNGYNGYGQSNANSAGDSRAGAATGAATNAGSEAAAQGNAAIPMSALEAIIDIQEAWVTGKMDLIQAHLSSTQTVRLLQDGSYQRTLTADNYVATIRKAVESGGTQSFLLGQRAYLANGEVAAWGKHVYDDGSGNQQVSYACYWMKQIGGHWIIVAVNGATTEARAFVLSSAL